MPLLSEMLGKFFCYSALLNYLVLKALFVEIFKIPVKKVMSFTQNAFATAVSKIRFFLFFFLLCFCFLISGAMGQHALAQGAEASSVQSEESVPLSEDRLEELIDTLENEADRKEFLGNLEALLEASEAQNKGVMDEAWVPTKSRMDISDALRIEEQTLNLKRSYEAFLEQYGLNRSFFSQFLASIGLILLLLIFGYGIRRLSRILRVRLEGLGKKHGIIHERFRLYARFARYIGYGFLFLFAITALGSIWDADEYLGFVFEVLPIGFDGLISILFIIVLGIIIWEVLSSAIDIVMDRVSGARAARLRTLLPIVRNALFITVLSLFSLVVLSELGIDIVPLLAGAGVLGIAVGFGAQTLVKDFITGFIIILEDLVQVGDVAKLGDRIGLVEKITIRKVQLRDLSGIVYTVPFSEITIVENWTKEFSYYAMDIGVAYRENTDEVVGYLKEVDEDMRADEHYGSLILEPLEILGVDAFADSAVIIKARIKTLPIKQWEVGREFNRRMKYKFDEKGVEIPFPHRRLYFGELKDGSSPPAHIINYSADESAEIIDKAKQADKKK